MKHFLGRQQAHNLPHPAQTSPDSKGSGKNNLIVPPISDIRNENTLTSEFPFFCACFAVRLLTVGGTWAGRSLGRASLAKRNGEGTTVEVDTL